MMEVDHEKLCLYWLLEDKPFSEITMEDEVVLGGEEGMLKLGAIVGNPPYQEIIGSRANKSLSKQLYPSFITIAIKLQPKYLSLITPSRWFTGNAQDRSFVTLREFLRANNHFSHIINYLNSSEVFGDVSVPGGVNYFLYQNGYSGEINFTEMSKENKTVVKRPLFEEGLDVVLPMNRMISILRKVTAGNFKSMEEIVTGRNPFGIPATDASLNRITTTTPDMTHNTIILCAYEEIKYISSDEIKRNKELSKKWKVFTSKMNGGAGTLLDDKVVAILGRTFVMGPDSICSNTLLAVGNFDNQLEADNLNKYMNTKFFRFMLGIKKIAQVLTSNIYSFVPQQNFNSNSDIDWGKTIPEIDTQLYAKYDLDQDEIDYIESRIKSVE